MASMQVTYDNIVVTINNEAVQNKIKSFITKTAKMTNAHQPWSEEDEMRLVEMFKAGVDKKEIAKELKRTSQGVYNRLDLLQKRGVLQREKDVEAITI